MLAGCTIPKSHHISGGAASAAKPLVNEKKRSEPRRQEWAAASHGVGRKPGDGKAWYQYIALLSVTPTCVGVPVSFFCCTSGSARHADACRASPLAMGMSPCRAQNSSGFQPDKHQFIEQFFKLWDACKKRTSLPHRRLVRFLCEVFLSSCTSSRSTHLPCGRNRRRGRYRADR